jgi:hypothetical protein
MTQVNVTDVIEGQNAFWATTGERQIKKIREAYMRAILRQVRGDIGQANLE